MFDRPMPTNLFDYVQVYDKILSPELCKEVENHLEQVEWDRHEYFSHKQDKSVSFEDDLYVTYKANGMENKLTALMWSCIYKYVVEFLTPFTNDWFNGWKSYALVRFNKYPQGSRMKVHCDHIHSLFEGHHRGIPILTILGAINDNYEGGELIICGEKVPLMAGSVVIFPSNFLYPHEVKPVTSGTRYSYVTWAW